MKNLLIILFLHHIASLSFSQTPQLINYQGVARDSLGHPLLNKIISLRLSILDSTSTGQTIFQESHSTLTSNSGLFNIYIGNGVNLSGNFSTIPWGKNDKWLKVEMDINGGNNFLLIGKTQFLSVPYSLYSKSADDLENFRVSLSGDSLFISKTKWIKIPNISDANYGDGNVCTLDTINPSTGSLVHILINTNDNNPCTLDGCNSIMGIFHNLVNVNDNNPCTVDACDPASGLITHNSTAVDFDGNTYPVVLIGGQCWFSKNLNTSHYRNGDVIPTGLSSSSWANASSGAYGSNGSQSVYGKLYNFFAVADSRNLCPTGYHVPSEPEWTTLAQTLGGNSVAGGPLKEPGFTHWNSPNTGATGSSGFNALPAGAKYYSDGSSFNLGLDAFFWTTTVYDVNNAELVDLVYNSSSLNQYASFKRGGLAIRCLGD